MIESNVVSFLTSTEGEIHSDLQRVDVHIIQSEDYEEIPEITEEDLIHATIKRPGQPDQPFREAPTHTP